MLPCHKCQMKRLPKASELPLYVKHEDPVKHKLVEQQHNSLEGGISVVRKKVSKYIVALDLIWNNTAEICKTGVVHSKSTYDYLTEDVNVIPRTLAIASGGLVGLLIGSQGGIFKKITYSSVGICAVASVCYPKDAKEYAQAGYYATKEKTSHLLKEYGGYDIEKFTSDAKQKFDTFTIVEQVQELLKSMKNWMKKAYPVEQLGEHISENLGDSGQGNPEDEDLYTTRK